MMCVPIFLGPFFAQETGSDYGLGFWAQAGLLVQMYRNRFRIKTASR
jgi:hypothetical protein